LTKEIYFVLKVANKIFWEGQTPKLGGAKYKNLQRPSYKTVKSKRKFKRFRGGQAPHLTT
jgi:hypothetical protein